MNPAILEIAAKVGVSIKDRSCDNDYIFDGQSIASHYYPLRWVPNGKLDKWGYPDETYERAGNIVYLSDHDLLHEIMHYAAAAPEQRDLPEFGLGYVGSYCQTNVSQVVDKDESYLQEKTTQFLCCFFGSIIGICPDLIEEPGFNPCSSWPDYFDFKVKDAEKDPEPCFHRAIGIIQALGY